VEKREEGVAASAEVRRSKRRCCVCFQSFALVVAAELESKELESKERESKELENKKLENKGGITWMTTRTIPLKPRTRGIGARCSRSPWRDDHHKCDCSVLFALIERKKNGDFVRWFSPFSSVGRPGLTPWVGRVLGAAGFGE
jgi:hypothetical protein